jgi:HK97 family phage major capsid protein
METKKIVLDGLEGKTLEVATAFNALADNYVELEKKTADISEIKSLKEKVAELEKVEVKSYDSEITALKNALIVLEEKANKPVGKVELKSVADAIIDFFQEKEIKSLADLKKISGEEFELKADNQMTTTSQTGTIGRTQSVSEARFPRVRPLAFLRQGITTGTVEAGKSLLMWNPAAYTSNVGYVGEYDVVANGNLATATEKTRGMAKLGGFQIVTSETFSDLPQFAQRAEAKLNESLELKLDTEILSGDGDVGEPTHIWGLKNGNMTAFDYTKVDSVISPNVSDLVDACTTQAELDQYKTNTVWMNPRTANTLRRTKDTTGQYVINQLITGELVMGGHRVITNTGIGATEMIVGDISVIQLWMKQNPELEFERIASKDAWKMHVRLRAQLLVEDEDVKGLIYVADIDTELDNLTTAS